MVDFQFWIPCFPKCPSNLCRTREQSHSFSRSALCPQTCYQPFLPTQAAQECTALSGARRLETATRVWNPVWGWTPKKAKTSATRFCHKGSQQPGSHKLQYKEKINLAPTATRRNPCLVLTAILPLLLAHTQQTNHQFVRPESTQRAVTKAACSSLCCGGILYPERAPNPLTPLHTNSLRTKTIDVGPCSATTTIHCDIVNFCTQSTYKPNNATNKPTYLCRIQMCRLN